MPDHKTTERGFKHYAPIPDTYGHVVRVYESSAADGPHLWVSIDGSVHLASEPVPHAGISFGVAQGSAAAHLTLEAATALRDAIDAAIKGHYQGAPDV